MLRAVSEERPLWRQGFDAVEGAVAPRLESLMGSDRFAVTVGLVTQAQQAAQRRAERNMRRVLHRLNLPAGSDVTRILNEIGKLQREVRSLSRQLEAAKEGTKDGGDTGNARPRRASTARR